MVTLTVAIDGMLSLAQEIHELALYLSESGHFTSDQFADMQQLSGGIDQLQLVLEEAQALPDYQPVAVFSRACRTPLNTILGFSQVFLSGMAGDVSEEHLSILIQISECAESILEMIQQLSDEFHEH